MTTGSSQAPDFSKPIRGPLERRALVEYVLNTPALQETDYLEWKTGYDLSAKPGAAATARQLIGFANRASPQAARHVGGHGYLLLGVEPGNLVGVPHWDSADIENWLSLFLDPELRYDVHVVETGGEEVLLFEVDPPQLGDPVFALQRASSEPNGKSLPEGTIYVRRSGKTDVHTAADLKRLVARSQPTGTTLNVRVEVDDTGVTVIDPQLHIDAVRDHYLRQRRDALVSGLPAPGPFDVPMLTGRGEFRSAKGFESEVDRFVELAKRRWPTFVAYQHIRDEKSKLVVSIVNDTDENFEDVVVDMTLPVWRAYVHLTHQDARELLKPPEEPAPYGRARTRLTTDAAPALTLGSAEIEQVGDVTTFIRYPPTHVRPRTTHRVDDLLFALPDAYAGQEIPVRWRVTARNTRGELSGTAVVNVPDAGPQGGGSTGSN